MSNDISFDPQLQDIARALSGVIFDVDGVLTDGRITYSDDGHEYKSFNVQDGASIKALMNAGLQVAIITGRSSSMVSRRARELGIEHLKQGVDNKAQALDDLIKEEGFPAANLAMVGDDMQDLALFKHSAVTLRATVANAHPLVSRQAQFITQRRGGEGICVELAWLIMTAKGIWT
ncbi:MAG: HAD hydrolase family protein [Pseudomonadota bacterium]